MERVGEEDRRRGGESAREWEMGKNLHIAALPSSRHPLQNPLPNFLLPSLKLENRPIRLSEVASHVVKLPQFSSMYAQFLGRVEPLLV